MSPLNSRQRLHPHFENDQLPQVPVKGELAMGHDPKNPHKAAPRVVNVRKHEFLRFIFGRHLKWWATHMLYLPVAVYDFLTKKAVKVPGDDTFARIFSYSLCSKMLSRELNAADLKSFEPWMQAQGPDTIFYKLDYSFMAQATPDPGMFVSPTVCLFKLIGDQDLEPLVIKVGECCISPENIDAWRMAKLMVMHNVNYALIVSYHPLLHFPMDAINVYTLKLPKGHILRQLLKPHLMLQLRINDAVRYSRISVRKPVQNLSYTPFFGDTSSLTMALYSGFDDQRTFQPYHFKAGPPDISFAYGRYLKSYYNTVYDYVKKVVGHLPSFDPLVAEWAENIAKWTPGFPGKDEIFQGDNLAMAIATFIFDVSIEHSAEHENYSRIPLRSLPFRFRIAPPTEKEISPPDLRKVRTRRDAFQHRLAWALFFKPSNLGRLDKTKYKFQSEELKLASQEFMRALRATDRKMQATYPGFPPLRTFSRSIQY